MNKPKTKRRASKLPMKKRKLFENLLRQFHDGGQAPNLIHPGKTLDEIIGAMSDAQLKRTVATTTKKIIMERFLHQEQRQKDIVTRDHVIVTVPGKQPQLWS